MIEKEYLTVNQISKLKKISSRHVRRIISTLYRQVSLELLHKDKSKRWSIHPLLAYRFNAIRKKRVNYYSFTIDPCCDLNINHIHQIMEFSFKQMKKTQCEINYTVERKKSSGYNHIHCYISCSNKKKLISCLRMGFVNLNYNECKTYDLAGWKKYITKESKKITQLKN